MAPNILYSAAHDDLFDPGKRDGFFPAGPPANDATLCAEMSRLAYCRLEPDFPFDRTRIGKILATVGFTCEFFEKPDGPRGEGSHGFLAQDAVKKLAVVAFRGTDASDFDDLAFDADFLPTSWPKGGNVHEGFDKALRQIPPGLQASVSSLTGFRKLFTGHSLGAAMATLFASQNPPDGLYTFGSPRVGDADFVRTLQGVQGRRYVDCCDLVARVPLELMNFAHFLQPHYIDRNRQITFNPDNTTIVKDEVLAQLEYVEKYLRLGNVPVRNLADHAPINYIWPVTADGT